MYDEHQFCSHCDRFYDIKELMKNHIEVNHSWSCGHCSSKFLTLETLVNHQKKKKHHYCSKCDRSFINEKAKNQHLRSSKCSPIYLCRDCNRQFNSEAALQQHATDKDHHASNLNKKPNMQIHCKQCDATFTKQAEFDKHEKSGIHNRPRDKIQCISEMCKKRFRKLSGLINHLEQGRCASGITRHEIKSLIQRHDKDGLVIEAPTDDSVSSDTEDGSSMAWDAVATPSTGSTFSVDSEEWDGWGAVIAPGPGSPISYAASDDGPMMFSALEDHVPSTVDTSLSTVCTMCPSKGRQFKNKLALQKHLSSPVHEKRSFHCPKIPDSGKRGAKNTRSFTTLGGLLAHLESGVCQGGIRSFCETIKYLKAPLREIGLDEKLLKLRYNL